MQPGQARVLRLVGVCSPLEGGSVRGLKTGFGGGLFFSMLGGSDFWGWLAQTWHCGLGVVDGASGSM